MTEVGLATQADWKRPAGVPTCEPVVHTLHYGTAGNDSVREGRRGNRKEEAEKKQTPASTKTQDTSAFFQLELFRGQREWMETVAAERGHE